MSALPFTNIAQSGGLTSTNGGGQSPTNEFFSTLGSFFRDATPLVQAATGVVSTIRGGTAVPPTTNQPGVWAGGVAQNSNSDSVRLQTQAFQGTLPNTQTATAGLTLTTTHLVVLAAALAIGYFAFKD